MNLSKQHFLVLFISIFSFQFSVAQQELIPPGTLKINDSLYMDMSPISNIMYQELLDFSEVNKENDAITVIFSSDTNFDGNWIDMYSKNPKYQFFPMLHITREQAEYYCKWRSERVQLLWDTKFPNHNILVLYRLPTIKEYVEAELNFKSTKRFKSFQADNPLKLKIIKHPKTKYVTYNISEITADDLFFGENWKGITPTELPNTYTGFRCICEVKTK